MHTLPGRLVLLIRRESSMLNIQFGVIDYALLIIYFAVVLGSLRPATLDGTARISCLLGRSIPAWITSLASISARRSPHQEVDRHGRLGRQIPAS